MPSGGGVRLADLGMVQKARPAPILNCCIRCQDKRAMPAIAVIPGMDGTLHATGQHHERKDEAKRVVMPLAHRVYLACSHGQWWPPIRPLKKLPTDVTALLIAWPTVVVALLTP